MFGRERPKRFVSNDVEAQLPGFGTVLVQDFAVQDLQTVLKAVGVYDGTLDGDFGGQTEDAVKRFQWNARTVQSRLRCSQIT